MAYKKKYYKTITLSNEKYSIEANVFYQDTQHGFRHGVDAIYIMNNEGKLLYSKTFDRPVTQNYLNRTWEVYPYQSVLKGAIYKVSKNLFDMNIDSGYIVNEVL